MSSEQTYARNDDFEANCIIGSAAGPADFALWLGGAAAASNKRMIRQLGITHVINCARELPCYLIDEGHVKYLRLDLDDDNHQRIEQVFEKAHEFIEESRNQEEPKGKILVHCQVGMSRSASIVLSYLVKVQRMSLHTAYDLVKSRRNVISPNLGSMRQLCDYECRVHGLQVSSFDFRSYFVDWCIGLVPSGLLSKEQVETFLEQTNYDYEKTLQKIMLCLQQ